MLHELQRAFAGGLFAPRAAPVLDRILGDGLDPARRLFVHYNTVSRSLTQVLGRAYPALQTLIGADAFDAAARRYMRRRPPADAALIFYGEGFGAFAAEASPNLDPQLVEGIAAIEWAQKQAFHAADAPVLTAEALRAVPAERLPGLVCTPHPALRLCESPAAAAQVWRAALDGDMAGARAAAASADAGPSRVAVTRPGTMPRVTPLTAGLFTLVAALAAGRPIQTALESAAEADAGFDLASGLAAIAGLAAFTAVAQQEGDPIDGESRN